MRCLSIKQPWASLIASGQKTVELRTRRTLYRGPLIVCACAKPRKGLVFPVGPLGVTICLVELVDCREATSADELAACCSISPGEFCWVLSSPRSLPAVPVKGQLSMWEPSSELLSALAIQ